jgi:two-component sensor histidine kinase
VLPPEWPWSNVVSREQPIQLSQHMSIGIGGPTAKPEPRKDRPVLPWLPEFVSGTPPQSFRAIGVAVLCFASALAVQVIFRAAGGSLIFATYYPDILVAGLLAGPAAGIFVTVAALLTGWWAFMPPQLAFFPMALNQQLDIAMYLVSSGCILFVTQRYREIVRKLLQHERERELVTKELEHRSKNTYAVIDVIVQKTLEDEPDRANTLSGRIRAVKFANDLLNHTARHTVLLKTLLLHEFVPYGEARFNVEGQEIVLLADTARHLSLVFHELVTNAAKYGALSKAGGRVLITWKNEDGLVRLEWTEEGGPLVSPPKKQGFGSRIVTQSLKSVSGSIDPTFAPEGLRCSITFRL